MTESFVVGIDLGGTKTHAGLARRDGTIVAERVVATPAGADEVVGLVAGLTVALSAEAGTTPDRVTAYGLGVAGVPGEDGGLALAPNLDGLESLPLAGLLRTALGRPVAVENDAAVGALGELHAGVGRAARDFVYVAAGTGIGMGVVVDGRLVRGARGAAGEISYLPLGADPLDPSHHRRGALEEAVAGDVVVARYQARTGRTRLPVEIFDAAGHDEDARAVLDEECRWLATGIAAVAAVLDPEVVVLDGGIGRRPDVTSLVRAWLGRLGARHVDLRPSSLGDRCAVVGAIHLALAASADLRGVTP